MKTTINKKIFSISATILSFVILFAPLVLYAALGADERIITCGAVDGSQPACSFNELLRTANNVIKFLLVYFATPLAAIIFAYAGFLYLFSGGNTENVAKAKKMMLNMIIGYVIALTAWLIISTIMKTLGYTGTTYLSG